MVTSPEVTEKMLLTGVYLLPNAVASQGKLSPPFTACARCHAVVLPLEMVDKSTSHLQTSFGPVFYPEAVQTGLLLPE